MPALASKRDNLSSVHLDAVRGVAALFVLCNHLRALFFVEYGAVLHSSLITKVLYLLTGLGHEAVMVFFVLSGFFISSSVIRSVRTDRWSWVVYAQNRLTRLYVVLVPALLLGLFWDRLGLKAFGNAGVYQGSPLYAHMFSGATAPLTSASIWFGNLFFLQDIRVPTFGSNGPLWSLSYEFWYYALFPLILLLCWPKTSGRNRLFYGILAVLILTLIGKTIALYFLVWLMGCAVSHVRSTRISRHWAFLFLTGIVFTATLLISRLHNNPNQVPTDFLIGLAFSAFMYALLSTPDQPAQRVYRTLAQSLSGISYTLYLLHVPLLVFLSAWFIGRNDLWQPTPRHLGVAAMLAGTVLCYTLLVWRLVEAKTTTIRHRLSRSIKFAKTNRLAEPQFGSATGELSVSIIDPDTVKPHSR